MLANYQSSSYNISYKYDYNGLRTSKSVYNSSNGTTLETKYYYDGKQLIKEKSGNDVLWFLYNYDGLLVGFELNGTTYYYEKNIQGDIIKIYDDTGKEEVEYTYDAWGKITSMSGNQTLGEKIHSDIVDIIMIRKLVFIICKVGIMIMKLKDI